MNLRIHSIQLISNHKTAKQTNKQFLFFSFFLKINIFYVRVKKQHIIKFQYCFNRFLSVRSHDSLLRVCWSIYIYTRTFFSSKSTQLTMVKLRMYLLLFCRLLIDFSFARPRIESFLLLYLFVRSNFICE